MGTWHDFFTRVCVSKGWPPTVAAVQAGCVVAVGENNTARFNPISTILPEPGSTPYNTFGDHGQYHVWNFPDEATGIKATADTWAGWPGVVRAIRDNATVQEIIAQIDEVCMGTPTSYYAQFIDKVLAEWPAVGNTLVVGTTATPTKGQLAMFRFHDARTNAILLYGGPDIPHLSPEDNGALAAAGVPLVPMSVAFVEAHVKLPAVEAVAAVEPTAAPFGQDTAPEAAEATTEAQAAAVAPHVIDQGGNTV